MVVATKMEAEMADIATRHIGDNGQTSIRLHNAVLTITPGFGFGAVVEVFDAGDPGGTVASLFLTKEQVEQLITALKEAR